MCVVFFPGEAETYQVNDIVCDEDGRESRLSHSTL